jgi:[acyl-carrier-protein] S-malonyltransferase
VGDPDDGGDGPADAGAQAAIGGSTTLERIACLFPGQGSQRELLRELVLETCPELLEQAIAEVGSDPFDHLSSGTRFVQPAVYCVDIAIWEATRDSISAEAFAGHSLAELVALVAAGSLSVEDGLRLVALRGRLTHVAASEAGGGMLLVRGPLDVSAEVADRCGVSVAADNSPRQTVLSGSWEGLHSATGELRQRGVEVTSLKVPGPFHSPLMQGAREEFGKALADVDFAPPRGAVYSCVTAEPFDDIPRRLAESLTTTVRWREVIEHLHGSGIDHFVEVGPGRAMTALAQDVLEGRREAIRFARAEG